MKPTVSQKIRREFLNFFKNANHSVVPSSSVVPHADPSLLFINAGMNQFKDLFLGTSTRSYTRAVSSQKCIRVGGKHNDLENVGHTSRHLTFFEMLGNFSFGDYFKKEAIDFAWDVSLHIFGFEAASLYATYFHEDLQTAELWQRYLPQERIIPMGEKDNFWSMAETGPCGPCSELLFDRGADFGSAKNPLEDSSGERFFEFWNLVFMQYNRSPSGTLETLPKKSVDTGAGLERVVSLKLGVKNIFETDVLGALIRAIENLTGRKYISTDPDAASFHVIADHLRSLAFASADGAQPSNIDRGYVLRKLLRRAVRYGKALGLEEPFLGQLLPVLSEQMGEDYPELVAAEKHTRELLTQEELSFYRTLKRGGNLMNQVMQRAKNSNFTISGEDAFKLKDTYGLPLDEIQLLAKDQKLQIDLAGFDKLEGQAKERSRTARKEEEIRFETPLLTEVAAKWGPTHFAPLNCLKLQAKIIAIIVEGAQVLELQEGQSASILLDQTPFYAEKGGQVGDRGNLFAEAATFEVLDCQSQTVGTTALALHIGKLDSGVLRVADSVQAHIDTHRRQLIANNHTATHLLHLALQKYLGPHVRQAGSLVDATHLRFDFSHHKPLTSKEIEDIENFVNREIRANREVKSYELTLEEASRKSEIKQFFGEKYGSVVRVVDMEESKELCGGSHVSRTGEIGFFKITKESALAAGVRRLEALTADEAINCTRQKEQLLLSLSTELKVQENQLLEKTKKLLEEKKELQEQLTKERRANLQAEIKKWQSEVITIGSLAFLIKEVPIDAALLKEAADLVLQNQIAPFFIAKADTTCRLLVALSASHLKANLSAQEWMAAVAPLLQLKGGGKKEMAQGAASSFDKIPQALTVARQWIQEKLCPPS